MVHCAALRKETSQSEEKVTTSGYCTKIKVNNCLCTYIHLYTVVEASWSRIYCTVNVFAKKNLVLPIQYFLIWGNTVLIIPNFDPQIKLQGKTLCPNNSRIFTNNIRWSTRNIFFIEKVLFTTQLSYHLIWKSLKNS